ncbi:MAG: hypothetical protein M0Z50_04850 [Planctomycetia bacterium]|nr:hypothetical protein [Planctomycetia bacterium]
MKKKYWEMNTFELTRATSEFNKEFAADKSKPLNVVDNLFFSVTSEPSVATVIVDPPLFSAFWVAKK